MNSKSLLLALLLAAGCTGTPGPASPGNPPPDSKPEPAASNSKPGPPPEDPAVDASGIEAAIKAGDAEKAKKLSAELLAKNPKNPKAHYYAGVSAEMASDRETAEKHYREALALLPSFSDAAVNLSAILLESKRAAEAVSVIEPLARKAADDPLLQGNYAAALSESGKHAEAAEVYGKLLAKKESPETRLGYASALLAAGKKDDAAKALRDGVARAGDSRDQLAAFGRALAQAGAFEDAIKALDKAIQLKSGADLLTYRALFKRSLKKPDDARADLEAAIKENAKFAPAYRYLGEVFEDLKKPADAKKAYEKAAELDPDGGHGKKAKEQLAKLKK